MKDLIKAVLDEQGWRYLESDNVIRLDVEGESSSWSSFFRLENDDGFSYYSILPVKVEEDKLSRVSELLHRINYTVRVGGFEIDLTDQSRGQIMFKTYGLLTDTLIRENPNEAKEIIRRVTAYNMLTMDYYSKLLLKAIYNSEINIEEILTERSEQV